MTDDPPDTHSTSPHKPPTEAVFLRPKHKEMAIFDTPIAFIVTRLPDTLIEIWHERSAIREFDGGLPCDLAEALALIDVIRMHPVEALSALTQK